MIKRIFDIIISCFLIILFIIPMFLISVTILIFMGYPILFYSKRIGKNCKIFLMPKFRTMLLNTPDVATHKLSDSHKYITSLGVFLRKYSLDELPQLFSVMIGEMSIIGPRPALFNQQDLIDRRNEKGINNLLPGVTGWAQINGRDNISIKEKVVLETFYIKNRSLIIDIKIIFYTILKVIKKSGISH